MRRHLFTGRKTHVQQYTERDQIALQIINLAKAEILLENPFLAEAVGRLTATPAAMEGTLSAPKELRSFTTDGERLGFDAGAVIAQFRTSDGPAPKHDLLHSVIHCIFMHPFVGRLIDGEKWNLAADIAAERVVAEVLGPRPAPRGPSIAHTLEQIEVELGCRATAEKLYGALKAGRWEGLIPLWTQLFSSDEHLTWYAPPTMDGGTGEGEGDRGDRENMSESRGPEGAESQDEKGSGAEKPHFDQDERQEGIGDHDVPGSNDSEGEGYTPDEDAPTEGSEETQISPDENQDEPPQSSSNQGGFTDEPLGNQGAAQPSAQEAEASQNLPNEEASDPGDTPSSGDAKVRFQGEGEGRGKESYSSERGGLQIAALRASELREEWSRVAINLAVNLETYARDAASAFSGFVADLALASSKKVDYRAFLRQFAALGEVMRVSDDEFDYVYYTYGMSLYGKMPLIEPLEQREEKRIREFVIVIDTSGSVQGNIVRTFVDTTFDILKDTECFHEQVNLRIIQCDAAVQSDDVITSLDELRDWGRSMRLYGGGGTDFRPAFRYVESLISQGEFENLGGLIYFTDGWGAYPEWMPRYRTAFVYYDNNYRPETVPPWAIQAVLNDNAIEELQEDSK